MNLLLATFWQVPHVGGVWKYMTQLKERLEELGHSVDLLGHGQDHKFVHIVNKNHVIPINIANHTSSADPVIDLYDNLRSNFQKAAATIALEEYDLIHTQDVLSTTCFKDIRPKHTALVATLHGCVAHEIIEACYSDRTSERSQNGILYFNTLEHDGGTAADCTVVANNWMKSLLTNEFHVPDSKVSVLHYGYDIESFENKMKQPCSIVRPPLKKVLIYTGRLAEFKGVHYLIGALKKLKSDRSDWECWIVGDGPKERDLKLQVKQSHLHNDVKFLGKRDDVPALLTLADILILPTLIENQPLSVIEAQISGTAVIASAVGGVPEIIDHGMTGILVPPKDEELLQLHIKYILQEDAFRKNLGERARAWALNHWPLNQAVLKLLEVYSKAISINLAK